MNSEHVRLERPTESVVRRLEHVRILVQQDRGIVHEHIDRADSTDNGLERGADTVGMGHVHPHGDGIPSVLQAVERLRHSDLIPSRHRHPKPAGQQLPARFQPDAAIGAGHQRDPA